MSNPKSEFPRICKKKSLPHLWPTMKETVKNGNSVKEKSPTPNA